MEPRCRSGGTGRRTGLKILRDLYSRTGSIPVFGTMFFKIIYRGSLVKRSRHRPFTAVTGVRFPYGSPIPGTIAQLGEHLPYKQGVTGSSPVSPTIRGLVVQLVRMPACHAGGRGFESLPGRHNNLYRFCWCGSMAEQLTCNQQVVGSTPITSSNIRTVSYTHLTLPTKLEV